MTPSENLWEATKEPEGQCPLTNPSRTSHDPPEYSVRSRVSDGMAESGRQTLKGEVPWTNLNRFCYDN